MFEYNIQGKGNIMEICLYTASLAVCTTSTSLLEFAVEIHDVTWNNNIFSKSNWLIYSVQVLITQMCDIGWKQKAAFCNRGSPGAGTITSFED